jgi:predicted O-linked N-acetylglucosamine transferase (SPINDLY family)
MSLITDEHDLAAALAHHRAGRRQPAETIYRQILARDPQQPDALHLLGVLAHQTGQYQTAFDLIRQSLALRPDCIDAYSNLGLVLKSQGKLADAIDCYRHALTLAPDYPELHYNLAVMLKTAGQLEEAIASYRRALTLRPSYPDALNNLSIALLELARYGEAIDYCRRAIEIDPDHPAAHNNLGNALKHLGRLDEAIDAYRRAVALQPRSATAHNNLAVALRDAGRSGEALGCFQSALSLDPNLAETHNNLGITLQTAGQLGDALVCFERAVQLKGDYPEALNNLGLLYKDMARLDDAVACFQRALAIKPPRADVHSNLIYTLLFQPDRQRESAHELQRWSMLHAKPLRSHIRPHDNDPSRDRRLKIGYVSPDFRDHCAASFLLPLLRNHDHSGFEIHCFASVPRPDEMTRQLSALADAWHPTAALTDSALAQLVRDQRIDILVDLTLHMASNRLLTFARKPAPVQVTWLGYPGSTGLATIDYRLSDPHLDPPDQRGIAIACSEPPLSSPSPGNPGEVGRGSFRIENSFQFPPPPLPSPGNTGGGGKPAETCDPPGLRGCIETTWRLPDTFWCYDPLGCDPPVNQLPAASNGVVTFGCLNNFCKTNPALLRLWASTLRQVPLSRLILLAPVGSARQRALAVFQSEGIDPSRIQFEAGRSRADYLRLYHQIDIALDSFPYNGHTTSLDAFWMGIPVVTLAGNTPVSRAGACQLTNLGLPELIARSEAQFTQIATELAGDLPRLAALRTGLRSRMEASPLTDAKRFARNIEQAYRAMWTNWCADQCRRMNRT